VLLFALFFVFLPTLVSHVCLLFSHRTRASRIGSRKRSASDGAPAAALTTLRRDRRHTGRSVLP
jgi:hypothetical protein